MEKKEIIFNFLKLTKKKKINLKQAKNEWEKLKRKYAKTKKLIPPNWKLRLLYQKLLDQKKIKPNKKLEKILLVRPVRSLSGIVNVSVLTKPYPCPSKCIFCPQEPGLPKSYLSQEPAVERAKSLGFDPYLQIKKRIEMLKNQGHPTDKIELRIIGGTFSVYPKNYRIWFLKRCFEAVNQKESKTLKEAQKLNEKSCQRIVGISVETRADLINKKEIKFLRRLGVTMVELGVQTVFDEILKLNKTNIKVKDIVKATALLKDAGFKVMYQMMPGLFGSNIKKDKEAFRKIFFDERFRPDWLKIYPTLVIKNTQLWRLWKEKKYKPYSCKKLVSFLVFVKKICPCWIRIARVQRDIPKEKIVAGCKISNLREIVLEKLKKEGAWCHCIRCREIKEKYHPFQKIYLKREEYQASEGKEIFLSFETKNGYLLSFLRLRIPFFPLFSFLKNSSIIRELHTFGPLVPLKEKKAGVQHKGLGKKLIKEAEKITKKEFGLKKIAVISAVGTREYYKKFGYKLKETYMIKKL